MMTTTIRCEAFEFSLFTLGEKRLKEIHQSLKHEFKGFAVKKIKLAQKFLDEPTYIFSVITAEGTLYIA